MALRSWGIKLQNAQPLEIRSSSFDLAVVDRDWWDGKVTRPYSAAEITTMETGADGTSHRELLAYMSIGQASNWRDYWNPAWNTSPPSWLGASDPNWPGSYSVHYWESGWQKLVFGSDSSYLDRIIKAGFDGVFLDTVSIFHQFDNYKFADGSNETSAQRMVDFVTAISAYAKHLDPGFQIFVNGGEDLLPSSSFMNAIDGINKESLYYGVRGLGVHNDNDMVSYSLGLLKTAVAAGKTVLNIEYVSTDAAITDTVAQDTTNHILPYVTPLQSLSTLDFAGSVSNDTLTGTSGDNHVYGLAGNDTLLGGAGNDWLFGGVGIDRLDGGPGNDQLTGGGGADVFHFGPFPVGRDVITDFQPTLKGEYLEFSHNLVPGVTSYQSLKSHISENAAHNAVIDLGHGDSVTLIGVHKADLNASDFLFL
jgi:cysteinyl-tRNA synthetase